MNHLNKSQHQNSEQKLRTNAILPETHLMEVQAVKDNSKSSKKSKSSISKWILPVEMRGSCYVKSSENNTHVTRQIFSLKESRRIFQLSGSTGNAGFTKSKRGTAYASEELIRKLLKQLEMVIKSEGIDRKPPIDLVLSGYGQGRLSALKILLQIEYIVETISDGTSLNHNGCRPKKPRRI